MNRKAIAVALTTAALTVPTAALAANHASNPHQEAANWAVDNGILFGTEDNQLELNEPITRGQAATMLYRYHHNCHTYNRQGNCDAN